MTCLKSPKRFGHFETLEAKKLFAADLVGSADVVSFNPREYTLVMPNPDGHEAETTLEISNDKIVRKRPGRTVYTSKLGGQEGEPVSAPASDFVLANLGGQQGEDVAGRASENSWSILPKSGPGSHSGNSYTEIEWT